MKLASSMLKACILGAIIATVCIFVIRGFSNDVVRDITISSLQSQEANLVSDISRLEEADQDPSFISRFSRVFIYSADDGKEVIESAKNSLPKKANSKVSAEAYVVLDVDRNAIVLEKNYDKSLPIASVTKLVTAVVARKLIDQNDTVTINSKILNTYGNEAKLREGEKFKVSELMYPLLMVSSNDSAEAIANSYFRGRQQFLREMNSWVNEIGAYQTYFADPSGLSAKNTSTAKDLSIIVSWIIKNEPEIFNITLLKSKTIRIHTWTNPTHFLNLTSYAGGKNGYTPEANRTSVALFKLGKNNRLYAVILLGSKARDSDMLDLLEEAIK